MHALSFLLPGPSFHGAVLVLSFLALCAWAVFLWVMSGRAVTGPLRAGGDAPGRRDPRDRAT